MGLCTVQKPFTSLILKPAPLQLPSGAEHDKAAVGLCTGKHHLGTPLGFPPALLPHDAPHRLHLPVGRRAWLLNATNHQLQLPRWKFTSAQCLEPRPQPLLPGKTLARRGRLPARRRDPPKRKLKEPSHPSGVHIAATQPFWQLERHARVCQVVVAWGRVTSIAQFARALRNKCNGSQVPPPSCHWHPPALPCPAQPRQDQGRWKRAGPQGRAHPPCRAPGRQGAPLSPSSRSAAARPCCCCSRPPPRRGSASLRWSPVFAAVAAPSTWWRVQGPAPAAIILQRPAREPGQTCRFRMPLWPSRFRNSMASLATAACRRVLATGGGGAQGGLKGQRPAQPHEHCVSSRAESRGLGFSH